jgi:hypothetical protein
MRQASGLNTLHEIYETKLRPKPLFETLLYKHGMNPVDRNHNVVDGSRMSATFTIMHLAFTVDA